MKKSLFVIFFLCKVLALTAQGIEKLTSSNAGDALNNAELKINFTIGEPLVGMVHNESSIDQGFWAGSLEVTPISQETDLGGIIIYPNPVDDQLNIYTDGNEIYGITLFAVNGKMALKLNVDSTLLEHKVNTSHLAKGMYVLRLFIKDENQEKLFKIIKK